MHGMYIYKMYVQEEKNIHKQGAVANSTTNGDYTNASE